MRITTVLAVAAAYGVFVDALGQDELPAQLLGTGNYSAPGALLMANDASICTTWGGDCTLSALSNDLKLGSTCAVNVPIPSDNYVADKRLNKHDNNGVSSAKPFIQIKSDGPETSETDQVAWKTYQANSATAQSKITFNKPGVYDVSMTASDYNQETTCPCCVSVRDTFQPRFAGGWVCPSSGPMFLPLSASSLGLFSTIESTFDAHAHIVDNNENSGDDCGSYAESWQPFTHNSEEILGRCFGATSWAYTKSLLESSPFGPTLEFLQDANPAPTACTWRCNKVL